MPTTGWFDAATWPRNTASPHAAICPTLFTIQSPRSSEVSAIPTTALPYKNAPSGWLHVAGAGRAGVGVGVQASVSRSRTPRYCACHLRQSRAAASNSGSPEARRRSRRRRRCRCHRLPGPDATVCRGDEPFQTMSRRDCSPVIVVEVKALPAERAKSKYSRMK